MPRVSKGKQGGAGWLEQSEVGKGGGVVGYAGLHTLKEGLGT